MAKPIEERFDNQTGRSVWQVGRFTYTVEDYDAKTYVVHRNDESICPEFVREVPVKTSELSGRFAKWEKVCEMAYRAAEFQSRA